MRKAFVGTEKRGWRVTEWGYGVGLCRATVWNLLKQDKLPSVKVGGSRIITISPEAYLQQMQSADQ